MTGKAEQKARRAIRLALGLNPHGVVIVTGCYAQVEADLLADLDERVVVVTGEHKASIHGLADFLGEEWQGHGELLDLVREWRMSGTVGTVGTVGTAGAAGVAGAAGADRGRFAFSPESFAFHSRPSIKIQDGCDNRCSYCRVCLARGPSDSLAPGLALQRVLALESAGAAEVVLTGVNLSQYRSGNIYFPGLLELLVAGSSRIALRLSSYEPDRVDDAFLEAFSLPRVRPHIHLAVQSGSDAVLARMGRRYGGRSVIEACSRLRCAKGDPFIGADMIAGFPGESEADFAETMELSAEAGFAWIHAFPFSARPGTAAWELRPQVPERVAGERVARLGALAAQGRAAYVGRWIGREVEAVAEGEGERATSENYLSLGLAGEGRRPPGQAIRCAITAAAGPGEPFDAWGQGLG